MTLLVKHLPPTLRSATELFEHGSFEIKVKCMLYTHILNSGNFGFLFSEGCDFYAHVQLVERRPTYWYGAPQDIWIQYVPTQAPPGELATKMITIDDCAAMYCT